MKSCSFPFITTPPHPPCPKNARMNAFFCVLWSVFSSSNPYNLKFVESFLVIMVGRPETRRLSASISWDAFRKGRSLARNHISICFFLTFQLTKAEELPTLCIEKPELTKNGIFKVTPMLGVRSWGNVGSVVPKSVWHLRKEGDFMICLNLHTFATGTW